MKNCYKSNIKSDVGKKWRKLYVKSKPKYVGYFCWMPTGFDSRESSSDWPWKVNNTDSGYPAYYKCYSGLVLTIYHKIFFILSPNSFREKFYCHLLSNVVNLCPKTCQNYSLEQFSCNLSKIGISAQLFRQLSRDLFTSRDNCHLCQNCQYLPRICPNSSFLQYYK